MLVAFESPVLSQALLKVVCVRCTAVSAARASSLVCTSTPYLRPPDREDPAPDPLECYIYISAYAVPATRRRSSFLNLLFWIGVPSSHTGWRGSINVSSCDDVSHCATPKLVLPACVRILTADGLHRTCRHFAGPLASCTATFVKGALGAYPCTTPVGSPQMPRRTLCRTAAHVIDLFLCSVHIGLLYTVWCLR